VTAVLAVDPGGESGLAWCDSLIASLKVHDERLAGMISLGQITGSVEEQAWKIHLGVRRLDVRVVIMETSDHFLLQAHRRNMRKHSLIPIEMNGAIKMMCKALQMQGLHIVHVPQTASQGKSSVSDEMLERFGFTWKKHAERHQMDAARHLITFMRRVMNGSVDESVMVALEGGDPTWKSVKPVKRKT
jgi:hypothetical protein